MERKFRQASDKQMKTEPITQAGHISTAIYSMYICNPHPTLTSCMQNYVTAVIFCFSSFRKNQMYTTFNMD